jgi:hypothetical protein
MPFDRNLGKRCRYATTCPLYQGDGIPENMTRTLWRNVFCYRGIKGWSNCEKYQEFEKENTSR